MYTTEGKLPEVCYLLITQSLDDLYLFYLTDAYHMRGSVLSALQIFIYYVCIETL